MPLGGTNWAKDQPLKKWNKRERLPFGNIIQENNYYVWLMLMCWLFYFLKNVFYATFANSNTEVPSSLLLLISLSL